MPTPERSTAKRLEQLERRILQLEREKATRESQVIQRPNLRLGKTFDDGDYPGAPATVFPVVFLDAEFVEASGNQNLTETEHDDATQVYAYSSTYVAPGTMVHVHEQKKKKRRHFIIQGGAAAGILIIRFHITGAQPEFRTVTAEITGTPAGTTVEDMPGQEALAGVVTIHDPLGCFFNETEEDLIGRDGWAAYMQPIDCENAGPAHDCEYEQDIGPQWETFSLCCPTPDCVDQA